MSPSAPATSTSDNSGATATTGKNNSGETGTASTVTPKV